MNTEHNQRRKIDRILAVRKKLRHIADEHSLQRLMQSVIDEAEKMTDSRIGYLFCLTADGTGIERQACSTMSAQLHALTVEASSCLIQTHAWQECLKVKKTLACNDFNIHNQDIRSATSLPFFRSLLIPIIRKQKIIAILSIGNKPTPYNDEDIESMTELGDLCWDIITQKQMQEQVEENRSEPVLAAADPRHAKPENLQIRYRTLLDGLNDAVFLLKSSTQNPPVFVEVNHAAIKRYGYSRQEFLHMNISSLVAPEQLGRDKTKHDKSAGRTPGRIFYESVHMTKTGNRFPAECSGTTVTINGESYVLATVRDISERKQAEARQRSAEKSLQLITDNVNDVAWMYDLRQQRYSYFSPAVERLRGHTPQEAMTMSMAETLTPESYAKAQERIQQLIDTPKSKSKPLELIQLQQLHKNGSIIDIEIVAQLVRDEQGNPEAVIGITRDITERKKIDKKLLAEKEKFRSLFEHITDYVLILKRQGDDLIITDMSESACRYHGYTRTEMLGQSIGLLDPRGFDPERAKDGVLSLKSGGTYLFETVHRRKDGTSFPVGSALKQIEIDGEPHLFAIEHDLTMHRKAEEERNELELQLRQKYKMEAVGLMAGGIAHNFNNNLAIILGNLELIKMRAPETPKLTEYLENATIGVHRSRTLVQQIMTYSHQNTHRKATIQPALVIEETCKLLRSTVPTSVELLFQPDCSPDIAIQADSTRIQEALLNLCYNAVHAMQEKGRLTIALHPTELKAKDIPAQFDCQPGLYACLEITDTGCGIEAEVVEKIFDPFFTTKDVDEGTGMGLATVLGIVEQHKGLINVASVPGTGTTFSLYFPISEPSQPLAKNEVSAPLPRGSERILLIDDDAMLAHVNATMLADMGYQVEIENDSIKALERLHCEGDQFDLVITDQTMPELTGDELAKAIRSQHPDLPIILCTGYSSKITAEDAQELGIAAFCIKPLDMPEMLRVVREVLDG